MEENNIETIETVEVSTSTSTKFLYIPEGRLVVLSIITLGIFEMYWMYNNWSYIKEKDNLDIMPFWRAVFGVFFMHSLLSHIEEDNELNSIEQSTFSGSTLATVWIVLLLVGNVLGKFDDLLINTLGVLVSAPSFFCLLPVQKHINRVNKLASPELVDTVWPWGQMLCLIFGIPVFILVLIGIFFG